MSNNSWLVLRVEWLVLLVAIAGGSPLSWSAERTMIELPKLSQPVTSFGGAVLGDYVYVYSGHIGKAHTHSKRNLSERFERLKLDGQSSWESLPSGPGLQSVALVTYGGALYRVGGLSALNEPEQAADLVSVTDFFRFDPQMKTWTALKPLPVGRSSHDAVVHDNVLYVVGGWNLSKDKAWHDRSLSIRLDDPAALWVELPKQPFERRALAAAALKGRIYALGGMSSDDQPTTDVQYFDVAQQTWSKGPSLPGKPLEGFGCSAIACEGKLYATTMNGEVHRLSADGSAWELSGKVAEPRFFHRLLAMKNQLLIVGGASMTTGHIDTLELFTPPSSAPARSR